jgi:plastocyanin
VRQVRRILALAALLVLAPQGAALAATKNVSIVDFAFDPQAVRAGMGSTVHWSNDGSSSHTSTQDTTNPDGSSGLGLWNSGILSPGDEFSVTLDSSATYTYHCALHSSMTGRVQIPVRITDVSTVDEVKFRIRWSVADAPSGLAFDVQIKRPGQSFADWRPNTIRKSAVFRPHASGTYWFRARLIKPQGGVIQGATLYSPARSVTVAL